MANKKFNNKVAITCAITGAIHTPTMSDALPYKPEDIARQAIDAAEAGAAVLHLHARHPEDGSVSINPDHFMNFLPVIKQNTNAVVNISTGGSLTTTIDDRMAPAKRASPEMCSLNMGSMNFSFHPLAKRYSEWKFDWEEDYVKNSDKFIFRNTFNDIAKVANELGGDHNIKFEHECYDVGHLYNLKHCVDIGLFKAPIFIQFIFGIMGGIGPELDNLVFMKRTADRLFGEGEYQWSVLGAGGSQMKLASAAITMGGNVRVGLEDSLLIARGQLAESNAQQVAKVRTIIEAMGYEVATPDDAREMLDLKGADRVTF
ncbi:MAG: 3-keto-5-aminohexanoate cleavage protein [Henriciella sp.]